MNLNRILIIENSVDLTGALKSITRTSYDLRNHFEFIFVIPRNSKARQWIEGKGFTKIYELPMVELSKRPLSVISYLPSLILNAIRLNKILSNEQVQLIHNNDLYNLLPLMSALLGRRIPYVNHVRFLPDKFPKPIFFFWLNLHLRYAQYVICVSHFLKEKLPLHPKIKMVYNELPVEERYPSGLPKQKVLLYLSNIISGKGHDYAINAFSVIAKDYPDWKLRFVGGDMGMEKNKRYREHLEKLCRHKGIDNQVEWIGFEEDVEKQYRQAAIGLNFSESESFSITCVEAGFFGCPMIATRSGGPSEIIIDGQTGLLVPVGNINSMVLAMRKLMDNPVLRSTFEEVGKQSVRKRFDVHHTSFKLEELYKAILNSL